VSVDGLTGYSRALYSNWLCHQPFQLIIDAGEGLALALGTRVFSVSTLAITHGHSDHVLGLPGFAAARRFGKGATAKPYTVLYPDGSPGIAAIREAIAKMWPGVDFPMTWIGIAHGGTHRLSGKRTLEAFAVLHVSAEPSLGYRVLEARHRLKPEFATWPRHEAEQMARQHGRDHVMEEYSHVVFAHSGDAMPVDAERIRHADVLVHDATFLEPGDRREPIHASAREVFELARTADVGTLILNHLSIRYPRADALHALRHHLAASGFAGAAWWLDESAFVNLR
jgi:ribonuclease Z